MYRVQAMIYQDMFNEQELKALQELKRKLFWSDTGINYLIAFIYLFSKGNAKQKVYDYRTIYGGYLMLSAKRVKRKYYTLYKLITKEPDNQILWFSNILTKCDDSLSTITEDVLNLPRNCPKETIAHSSQIHLIPDYKTNLNITKGDIMELIEGIVKNAKMD